MGPGVAGGGRGRFWDAGHAQVLQMGGCRCHRRSTVWLGRVSLGLEGGALRNQAEGFRFDGEGSQGCLEGDMMNMSRWKITQCWGIGLGAGSGEDGRLM